MQGANRYATTALVSADNFTPNAEFTKTADYLTRNVTTPATLRFLLPELPRARVARRLLLHFDVVTAGLNETMGTGGAIELSYEATNDGVNFQPAIVKKSGLIETSPGVYGFDLINTVAKGGRVSVTLSGTVNANIRLKALTLECTDLEGQLNQGARTARPQLATGAGNLLNAPYSMKMPLDMRAYSIAPAKENYTFAELSAEAAANPNIAIVTGPDANHIASAQIDTGSKTVDVFTFKKI
jgi:hypothetical protein